MQEAEGIWDTLDWSYDAVGNRTSEILTAGTAVTSTYNYPSVSNKLSSVTQGAATVRAFTHDAAGNITEDDRSGTVYHYRYNKRGRMDELTIGSTVAADYIYDGLERMAIRTTASPSATTHYLYDLDGHLLVEALSSGATSREYIWLDDMPLAVVADVETATPHLYFVHADHIERPILMTDEAKTVVWEAVYYPFGEAYSITGSTTNNLRFPGQYFLLESGLAYNWYRQYDPTLGRYVQPDPMEFASGPSLYAYARLSPVMLVDPTGEISSPTAGILDDWFGGGGGTCPANECLLLYDKINAAVNDLKKRYYEIKENKLGLPPKGPFSIAGHIQQFMDRQVYLRKLLDEARTKGCMAYTPDAPVWATKDPPVPGSGPSAP